MFNNMSIPFINTINGPLRFIINNNNRSEPEHHPLSKYQHPLAQPDNQTQVKTINQQTQQTQNEKPSTRRFWPVPPVIESVYEYQNVNKDPKLRKEVTMFFHKKVLKWIREYDEFKKYKNKLTFLESVEGQMHIYNLLRKFIKKSGINWFDLRDNYSIIKEYLSKSL